MSRDNNALGQSLTWLLLPCLIYTLTGLASDYRKALCEHRGGVYGRAHWYTFPECDK